MDLLLLIAAVVALVWTVWFILRGSLIGGCLAAIIAAGCLGFPFWHAEGGIPLTIDRAMIALLAVAYLVQRRWGMADPKPMGGAEWVLIAFLLVLTASTFTHDWHLNKNQPAIHLVLSWIFPAVVFWIARQSPIEPRTLRWTYGALAVFGVYLTFTALAEATRQWWAVFPGYISNPATEFYGRARGPFLHPAAMGIYLTLCSGAALTFWPRLNRYGQLLLLGFTSLAVAGIYFTLTRSAWMGGGLGLAIFVGCTVPRQWRTLLLSAGALVGVAALAASWDSVVNLKRDVKLDAAASADSAELRPILAKVAVEMFRDRPLWGCGYGQYDTEKLPYLADRSGELPLEKVRPYVQHNAFLALLTETGLAGAGLFAVLMLLWLRSAWRVWASDKLPLEARQMGLLFLVLVGAYLPNAMFQDTNIIDGVNLVLFFAAGIVSGLVAGINVNSDRGEAATRCRQIASYENRLQHA